MSEVMDQGVIGMPFDMAMHNDMSRRQFYNRAQAILADRDTLAAENAELRTALADTDRLASEAAQRNEDLGRRVYEMEKALRKINMRVTYCLEDGVDMGLGSLENIQIIADEALSQQAKP